MIVVATEDFEVYHGVVTDLRERGVEFTTVEPGDAIEVAREIARDNGLDGRVRCLRARVQELPGDETFDLIVSDLHGLMPQHGDHLAAIRDASSRLLREGGRLVPARDELFARSAAPRAVSRGGRRSWFEKGPALGLRGPGRRPAPRRP